jgi:DNA polymerase-3 subunit delta
MVAVKAHQAKPFLEALDRIPHAVLFYGTDAGLVSERAALLARRLAEREAGEVLRIDDADLEHEPARIAIELQTVAMFGGRKIVRALAGRRVNANALKPLVDSAGLEGVLIVEAGNLRPDEALRTLFERSPRAAAVACFPDDARDLDGIIGEVFPAAGAQTITPDARRLLLARLGADRVLSRAEIEKLALFARGKSVIEEADVEAATGDAAELALDRVAFAAASGRVGDAIAECDRSIAAGESAQSVIAVLQRHFLRLHALRSGYESGRSLDDAMRSLRPQPHFKQKAAIEQQCRDWRLDALNAALARIGDAARAARLNNALESTLAEALLIDLGKLAGAGKAASTRGG